MSSRRPLSRPVKRRGSRAVPGGATASTEAAAAMGAADSIVMEAPAVQTEPASSHDGDELTMAFCAHELWAADYRAVFEREYEALRARCGHGYALPPSSYVARLSGEQRALYEQRARRRERDQMAIALHANNMRHWTPSLLARSICAFSSNTQFTRAIETQQARQASAPSTWAFMRLMLKVQPKPSWTQGRHVNLYVADQTYEWVGMKKRGRRQALQRHDAHGMPVGIEHVVYINSIKVHLPSSLGDLSLADIQAIQANNGSPYTEDYNQILDPLQPRLVEGYLSEFSADVLGSVVLALARVGQADASQLGLRTLAGALFDRPNVDPGGPSAFDILEPLMNTDTKSHEDWRKIANHCSGHSGPETVVDIFMGDGQSCIMAKNEKVSCHLTHHLTLTRTHSYPHPRALTLAGPKPLPVCALADCCGRVP